MSTTSSVSTNTVQDWYSSVSSTQTATTSTTNKASDQESRFLTLLTSQLKNQDPLNPMDNAETTSQLAQISTVTGIEKLNATLTKMMSSNQTSDTLQAANLVGHSVLVEGNQLALSSSMAVGGYVLDKPASSVTVSILDSNGATVQTLELGEQEAGVNEFVWDGQSLNGTALADGSYTVKISAKDKDGSVEASPLELAKVGAVLTADGDLKIDVGRLGRVSMSDIKLIL
ncbi:MAG: flagellar hook assembly protein FlgD [Uliginosibacterium sp.]|jgi:flagellar basal-body rod modification protein FlgD|nr:flagellar hook assembly protein FlgD [Uliginosibacterium sp.]